MLFVENLLVGNWSAVGRIAPGPASAAITGQDPDTLLSPLAGLALLVAYAVIASALALRTTAHRDVA